jgi:hypothetical protein
MPVVVLDPLRKQMEAAGAHWRLDALGFQINLPCDEATKQIVSVRQSEKHANALKRLSSTYRYNKSPHSFSHSTSAFVTAVGCSRR